MTIILAIYAYMQVYAGSLLQMRMRAFYQLEMVHHGHGSIEYAISWCPHLNDRSLAAVVWKRFYPNAPPSNSDPSSKVEHGITSRLFHGGDWTLV